MRALIVSWLTYAQREIIAQLYVTQSGWRIAEYCRYCSRKLACVPVSHNRSSYRSSLCRRGIVPTLRKDSPAAPLNRGLLCKRVLTPFFFQQVPLCGRILHSQPRGIEDPSQRLTPANLKVGSSSQQFWTLSTFGCPWPSSSGTHNPGGRWSRFGQTFLRGLLRASITPC